MAINSNFLVQSKDLQQYFVDKDTGLPLANGTVELFEDQSRLVHKNWYEQTGIPPNYTYTVLPNPMTLSAVGTVQDDSGNDVLPLYYPYDESSNQQPGSEQLYYIVVKDSDGEIQWTRSGFPFPEATGSSPTDNATFRNYIVNNTFWRNVQTYDSSGNPTNINLSNQTQYMVAPSQHDGFSQPDWQFLKGNTSATDGLMFLKFQDGTVFTGDIMPEFYVNFNCTALGTNEQFKVFQVPLTLHLITLDSVQVKFTIQIQGGDSNPANKVSLYYYQFLGTGAASQPNPQFVTSFTCTTSWKKNEITFTTPSLSGLTLGPCGDDALYIQIGMPIGAICNINFTLPSLYIGNTSPTNDFEPYDYWDAFINNYRTGDFRTSLNAFLPGWVAANDGSIGSFASGATNRANSDTWPLYNLLWNSVLNNWAPVAGSRGVSASADFIANKAMTLTRNLGRVIQGLNPTLNTPNSFTTAFGTNAYTFNFATAFSTLLTVGTPVQVYPGSGGTLPTCTPALTANTVYYVSAAGVNAIAPTLNALSLATTLDDAYAGINTIQITANGTAPNFLTTALGAYIGTSGTSQVPNHVHTAEIGGGFGFVNNGAGGNFGTPGASSPAMQLQSSITTDNPTGGVASVSLLQPTVSYNVFIKL